MWFSRRINEENGSTMQTRSQDAQLCDQSFFLQFLPFSSHQIKLYSPTYVLLDLTKINWLATNILISIKENYILYLAYVNSFSTHGIFM